MSSQTNLFHLVEVVAKRSMTFLQEEIDLDVSNQEIKLEDVHKLELKYLTSLMSIEGPLKVYLAFSFEQDLLERVFQVYSEDIEIEEDEVDMYLEETAGDVINIILGNATADLSNEGPAIYLSPPVIITEAKNIVRHRGAQFITTDLVTDYGNLSVYCVGPKDLFDELLNYV